MKVKISAFVRANSACKIIPRLTINRGLIVLIPKQPVLDWIMQVDPNPPLGLTLEELSQEQDAFLVSQRAVATVEDAQRWVYRRWKMFFERYLDEWYTEESWWPKNRSLKMFKQWFDIQYQSMVWDLSDEMIEHEDWD
jgi:hypothetical protein